MDSGAKPPGTRPVNFVYLSGEAQPLTIQLGDRRFWLVEADQSPATKTTTDHDDLLRRVNAWHAARAAVVATEAHPSRRAPLCRDCRHLEFAGDSVMRFEMCGHPSSPRGPVTGAAERLATSGRGEGRLCGPAGLLFQPRHPSETKGPSDAR